MGKYDGRLGGLKRADLTGDRAAHQDLVNARKDEIRAALTGSKNATAALAAMYVDARQAVDAHEELKRPLTVELFAVEQLLQESYEDAEITSVKLADGRTVSVQAEPVAQVRDREAARVWALANGYERSMMLPSQTISAIAKQRFLDDEPLPDGVELSVTKKTVLRKG